jgi:hypothetical protein
MELTSLASARHAVAADVSAVNLQNDNTAYFGADAGDCIVVPAGLAEGGEVIFTLHVSFFFQIINNEKFICMHTKLRMQYTGARQNDFAARG